MTRKARNLMFGAVGAMLALAVGFAVAAMLSTSITGNATIRTAPGDPEPEPVSARQVSAVGTVNGPLDCRPVSVSGDSATLVFKPVLTRPADGQTANATCTVTLNVRNTGTTTLTVDPSSGFNAPAGWSVSGVSGAAVTSPIKPGELKSAKVTVTATPAATEGAFSGKLAYNDGQS